MKLLLIGGPKFVGYALIEAALARGHEVTTFNRGQTNPDALPAAREAARRPRRRTSRALEGRTWDAVLDTSGYVPRHVRDSARAACERRRPLLSSSPRSRTTRTTASRASRPTRPSSSASQPDDRLLEDYSNYGALKALCEQEVERAFGDRAILVRPGLIVGPNDPTDRFTYWPRRAERGGPILAPPDQPVQMIDVRDLADWMIRLVEDERSGPYNATSPPNVHTFCFDASRLRRGGRRLGDAGVPRRAGLEGWSDLPCWIRRTDADHAAFQLVPVDRAVADGLTFRPLAETARDVPEWTGKAGLSPEREAELLEAWRAA